MTLPERLRSCETRSGASEAALRDAEQRLGRPLPEESKALLLASDGLEGFISEDGDISLWSASELASSNDAYAVSDPVPGVTLVGTACETISSYTGNKDELQQTLALIDGLVEQLCTVIETAKLHGIDPDRHLRAAAFTADRGEVLLPSHLTSNGARDREEVQCSARS